MTATRAATALLAIALASCGGGGAAHRSTPTGTPHELDFSGHPQALTRAQAARVTSLELTSHLPPRVRRACHAAPFRCPRLVPAGGITRIPEVAGGPLETGRDFYDLSYNNGSNPGYRHWVVGAGTPAGVARTLIDDRDHEVRGLPRRIRLLSIDGTRIAVYRWHDDAGGYLSGHTAAFADLGRRVVFASVHGHTHADADVALVADMISP
jgi:hypothetical protein